MPKITVNVGEEVFSFSDFEDWCATAKWKFEDASLRSCNAICIDTRGRVCQTGIEFMRARDDRSYPIRVFKTLCD